MSGTARVFLAAAVGAIIVFVWSAIFWMALGQVLEPVRMLPLEQEAPMVATIDSAVPGSGAYFFPSPGTEDTPEARENWESRHRAGPLGLVLIRRAGAEPMSPRVFVRGLILNFVAALLVSWGLTLAARNRAGYAARVWTALGFGLFAAIVSYGALWNWMYAPTDFVWKMSLDVVAGWLLAGLAMAAIIKPHGMETVQVAPGEG